MKKLLLFLSIIIIFSFAFGTAQVYADTTVSSGDLYQELAKKTPRPNARGGSEIDRKATQQAEKDLRDQLKATEQALRSEEKAAERAARDAAKAAREEQKAAPKAERNADKEMKGKKVTIRGIVAAVDATSLTVDTGGGGQVVLGITDQTEFKIPTLGKSAAWEDLNVGVQVKVSAREGSSEPEPGDTEVVPSEEPTEAVEASETPAASGLVALKVMVIPGKPAKIHRVGVVTAYTAGESITILAKDGQEYTFVLSETTKILPKDRVDMLGVGAIVTIISRRDPTGGPLAAQGIVVHPGGTLVTETPTGTLTETPTNTPTMTPTDTPTVTPTDTPTVTPTVTPTDTPTVTPTDTPTVTPTGSGTEIPYP